VDVICICLIFTYKGTKNISLLQLFGHFSYVELTLLLDTKDTDNDDKKRHQTIMLYLLTRFEYKERAVFFLKSS